ncbi:MAG: hypothetical protein ACOX3Q_07085 [Clostridia bacterium]|jgi:hypothetical protein|nr:hypothetical protein [Clostridiaceae bacterium]
MSFLIMFLVVGIVGFFDVKNMVNSGLKKELIVYSIFLGATVIFATLYLKNPLRRTILDMILDLFQVSW